MTVLAAPSRARLLPSFGPRSISWRTISPSSVEIAVELENESNERTDADALFLSAAPLGAFLPFGPVARLPVSGLAPGERRRVAVEVPMARLGLEDMVRARDLLSSRQWIGNLDVRFEFAPERAVEVHRALGLKLPAGHPAVLVVGIPRNGRASSFEIESTCSDEDWRVEVAVGAPYSCVTVRPPDEAGRRAEVVLRVRRRADGKEVPVELSFATVDPQAKRGWRGFPRSLR